MTPEQAARRYAAFYETLTPTSLDGLEALCAPDVCFRDPFNDVTGIAAYRAVLEKMFRDVTAPRFVVHDRALSGAVCYLRWTFTFEARRRRRRIIGMSEIQFDESGRATRHFDYWDPSPVYAMVPLLRGLLAWLRRRLKASY